MDSALVFSDEIAESDQVSIQCCLALNESGQMMMISFRFFTLLLVALSTLAPCHKINAPFYGFLICDYLDRPNSQRTVTAE